MRYADTPCRIQNVIHTLMIFKDYGNCEVIGWRTILALMHIWFSDLFTSQPVLMHNVYCVVRQYRINLGLLVVFLVHMNTHTNTSAPAGLGSFHLANRAEQSCACTSNPARQ